MIEFIIILCIVVFALIIMHLDNEHKSRELLLAHKKREQEATDRFCKEIANMPLFSSLYMPMDEIKRKIENP